MKLCVQHSSSADFRVQDVKSAIAGKMEEHAIRNGPCAVEHSIKRRNFAHTISILVGTPLNVSATNRTSVSVSPQLMT